MPHLELTHIQKAFGASVAVEDFNLAVNQGEFVSFLGPSGCGKTTTLRMVAGFEIPTSGSITLNGKDLTNVPPNRRNVGMVFQSYALFPNMTVAQNVGYGLKIAGKSKTEIETRVKEMLSLIQMDKFAARFPYQLSGGQQQRVALARALAIRPEVLLLDEPLSALDAKIRVELRQEIRRIQQQLGITTIYVTHDQEEALSLSDRIVVMSQGKMEQESAVFESPDSVPPDMAPRSMTPSLEIRSMRTALKLTRANHSWSHVTSESAGRAGWMNVASSPKAVNIRIEPSPLHG